MNIFDWIIIGLLTVNISEDIIYWIDKKQYVALISREIRNELKRMTKNEKKEEGIK